MTHSEKKYSSKQSVLLLRHAKYIRNLREDVASPEALKKLDEASASLYETMRSGNCDRLPELNEQLAGAAETIMPPRQHPVIREYVEVLAVALSVAMAVRAYFLQPFKIPTGSMQPTLYGIHHQPLESPRPIDRMPLKPLNWLIRGEWYKEIKAQASGPVEIAAAQASEPDIHESVLMDDCLATVGGATCRLPKGMYLHVRDGDSVVAGRVLASGIRIAGDHLFVDKLSWNFRKPRRSEVAVFTTKDVLSPPETEKHYIKRIVGLPNEQINIRYPNVYADGRLLTDPMISRIACGQDGYSGYYGVRVTPSGPTLSRELALKRLAGDEYLMLGDNSRSSYDARYWRRHLPRDNFVGPGWMVYWPFSERWGRIRR